MTYCCSIIHALLDKKSQKKKNILTYEHLFIRLLFISSNSDDICQVHSIHPEKVEKVRKRLKDDSSLQDLSGLFKMLGDHTRIRILHTLSIDELCVCDLAAILNMSQSAISHQLRILRTGKIIKYRKEGKNVFYSLEDGHISTLLSQGMEHIVE